MHLHMYEQLLAAGTCPGHFGVAPMQCKVSVLVKLQMAFRFSRTDQGPKQLQTNSKRIFSALVVSLSALCIRATTCLSLCGLHTGSRHTILTALTLLKYIGTTTDTTSNLSSTCVVPALVKIVSFDLRVSNKRYKFFSAACKSAVVLTMTVKIASEMLFNAFQ